MRFLQNMVWMYRTTDAVNENDLVTVIAADTNKTLQSKDAPLAMSYFAQLRTDLVEHVYRAFVGLADACKHQQEYGAPVIGKAHLIPEPQRT